MTQKSRFPTTECDTKQNYETYHTCRGSKRLGYTYDPGAAGGLAGTDTVLEYQQNGIPDAATFKVVETEQTYSGISGEPNSSVGEIIQKTTMGRLNIDWHADLIGGHG